MCSSRNLGRLALAALLLLSFSLAACFDAGDPAPSGTGPVAESTVGQPRNTLSLTQPQPTTALPLPTPHPGNTPWVVQRMDAVILVYDLSDAGASLLKSLDLRQMRGEPGFFGSYGFKEWTGVGEAKPIGVMHELGHAYWGGFPVEGFPELSWETPAGEAISPAMELYHADTLRFMAQPPDGHEVLRQRMRNLPNLSQENPEPLFHNLEADLVYATGGDLALTPPILRKYWTRFLKPGAWESWPQAVAWYQSLDDEARGTANKWLGFEHLDLRRYGSNIEYSSASGPAGVNPRSMDAIDREERQRLFDLADQFDLLLGDSQQTENFQFWRGYLRDKLILNRSHPSYLPSLDTPIAHDLARALDFLDALEGLPADQRPASLESQLAEQPFLVNFLPVLDNNILLELFSKPPDLPPGATLQATASFVERLQRFTGAVDRVLAAGAVDPKAGGKELTAFLRSTGYEPREDVKLFLELLRDADLVTASRVMQTLPSETVARLMEAAPHHMRTLLTPPQLLKKLNVAATAQPDEIAWGIALLLEHPSGNFRVEEPYLTQMHQIVAKLAENDPEAALSIIKESAYPLDSFIQEQPLAAVAILGSDIQAAVQIVKDSDPVLSPPARIIYRLISTDPVFAAVISAALDESGEEMVVVESLAYFAYDETRMRRWPDLGISLERDGAFLEALWRLRGGDWLRKRSTTVLSLYREKAAAGEVSPGFIDQYRATWYAAVSTLPPGPAREELSRMLGD